MYLFVCLNGGEIFCSIFDFVKFEEYTNRKIEREKQLTVYLLLLISFIDFVNVFKVFLERSFWSYNYRKWLIIVF